MTREALNELKLLATKKRFKLTPGEASALDVAIKALRQDSILDKIMAEIKKLQTYKMFDGEDTVYVECKDILQIIDKYKKESEE